MSFQMRPLKRSDADGFWEYAKNPKIAANMRDSFPSAREEAVRLVESFAGAGEGRACVRAIEIEGRLAGTIAFFPQTDVARKSAELSYWLGEPFWGRGIMTEAVRRMCGYAFGPRGLARIYAAPYAFNAGSRRVLEKAGFRLEGTLRKSVYRDGNYYDSCLYALIR